MINIFKKDIFLIFTLYTLAHGLILLNRGIFWDDWVLYNKDSAFTIDRFWQAGLIWFGYFHSFLLSFDNAILFYRLLVFLAFFLSALLLNSLLKNIKEIDSTSRLFIVLFFALFPVNSARIALITAPYALSYFLFFLGFWLVSKYIQYKNIILRFMSLMILFFAFFTNSLLVFYSLVILYILYYEKGNIYSVDTLVERALKYVDFLLLPVVFWTIKKIYLVPYGEFQGYTSFKLQDLWLPLTNSKLQDLLRVAASNSLSSSFYWSFIEVIRISLQSLSFILLIFAAILTLFILNQKMMDQKISINYFLLFIFGMFSFFIAVYPYNVIGYIPIISDWASRHMLLVPLGASFILYYGLKIILFKLNFNVQMFIFSVIIILFINANINSYIEYDKDWYKQVSLIENFKSNENFKNHTTFIFIDNTLELNANKRYYRFYEYTGLMKYAFGDERRFGESDFLFEKWAFKNMSYYKPYLNYNIYSSAYNMKEYQIKEPELQIVINYGEYNLNSRSDVLSLKYYELFENEKFKEKIDHLVSLEIVKLK